MKIDIFESQKGGSFDFIVYMAFCRQFPLPRQSANWHTFAMAKTAKAAKPKHKNRPFSGAFPKNKMYLFIKFSTRTHIQLEMGLKLANFGPIPSQKFFF